MTLLAQSPSRYLRTPLLRSNADGGASLWTVEWHADGESLMERTLDGHGDVVGDSREIALRAEGICILDCSEYPPRIAKDPALEDIAVDPSTGAQVHIERVRGSSQVWLTIPSAEPRLVWEGWGTAAAPAVAKAAAGTWVAFHHNVREDNNTPDITKWIALRFVDDEGRVFEPADPMRERDRDREGEEQGFEFPALVVGGEGGLVLYGRGSHSFYRQSLNESGWGPRESLGNGVWGCRGRRVSCAVTADGRILTARREREGIVVEEHAPASGRSPRLVAARVQSGASGLAPTRTQPLALPTGERNLYGDIHQHSAHSDGCGSADEPYLRARYLYGDDFCALSDHESFLGKRIGPGEWAYLQAVANRHQVPSEFATIFAYEWTGRSYPGPGHKVVYMPQEGAPVISRDIVTEGRDVVAQVRELGGFCVPHHVGWTGANEDAHDPISQPVWEICSCHGCYESFEHPLGQRGDLRDHMIDAVLKRGHRFGFIACSDGHGLLWHHGVGRKRDPFRTGLTVVQSNEVSRASILAAIRARRCYATSGVRIELDVRVHDKPMGSILDTSDSIHVTARARGTAAIRELRFVGPDGILASAAGEGADAALAADVKVPYVYARVEQVDGEMAWSSPIFTNAR